MQFLELYGAKLDIELGTDSTVLFTTARRKSAINEAVLDFIRRTGLTKRYGSIPLVTGTAEYSLDVMAGYRHIDGAPSIKIVTGSTTRYIQGPMAFPRYDVEQLDADAPGWKASPNGTPSAWYLKRDGAQTYVGVTPAPDTTGSTWTLIVPYVSAPPGPMIDDEDAPLEFTDGFPTGYPVFEFYLYHQALVHYAAARLEALRKNYDGIKWQLAQYQSYVSDWFRLQQKDSNPHIPLVRNYYRERPNRVDGRT